MLDSHQLELSFGLSTLKLVTSLQSSKVGLCSSASGGCLFCLLDCLGGEELLFLLLGLCLLGGFFSLEALELILAFLFELFLLDALLLSLLNFLLKLDRLLEFDLSYLFLGLEFVKQLFLLNLLLLLQLH